MKYDQIKISKKLEENLSRLPLANEIINAEKDPLILCELLFDEIDDLKKRVSKLEKP